MTEDHLSAPDTAPRDKPVASHAVWLGLILLALTDFVVGARVKGNARQMSDKLQFVAV